MTLVSVKKASQIVGKNEDAIKLLVSEGKIKAKEINGVLKIDHESLIDHYWYKMLSALDVRIANDVLRDYHHA